MRNGVFALRACILGRGRGAEGERLGEMNVGVCHAGLWGGVKLPNLGVRDSLVRAREACLASAIDLGGPKWHVAKLVQNC